MSQYKVDADARYAKSHEWARKEGDIVVVGISDYAQDTLSDVVYVELPAVGSEVVAGKQAAVVELEVRFGVRHHASRAVGQHLSRASASGTT